jgi:predicted transcriptional regulator
VVEEVELSALDLRYEGYRMKNPPLEARLLASITERGIEEPLETVAVDGRFVLLNGFKRYRSARKLRLETVPHVSLGTDEASGILALLRASSSRTLGIIEEARFLEDLRAIHGLSVADIAETLSRSKAWVSMRLGLLKEMGEAIRERILGGAFPVYAYMYTARQFMRMNGVRREEVEAFVESVSGKKLSVREIESLAHGYFRGPEWFRREVKEGNLALLLERMKKVPQAPDGSTPFEQALLRDLEILGKYMQRVMGKSQDPRLESRAFWAQANLLVGGVLSRFSVFGKALRDLHDRSAKA